MQNLTNIQKDFLDKSKDVLEDVYNTSDIDIYNDKARRIYDLYYRYYAQINNLPYGHISRSKFLDEEVHTQACAILNIIKEEWKKWQKEKREAELLDKEAIALIEKQDREAVVAKRADEIRAEREKEKDE